MRKPKVGEIACIVAVFCIAAAVASPAQTFTTLVNFEGPPYPANPWQLVQGIDGNFYGVSFGGGKNGTSLVGGTFFRMTPAGKVTVLYSFCSLANCADGNAPDGLIQTSDGKFYGAALLGGTSVPANCTSGGCGTFFEIVPGQAPTTLYTFCQQANCADGWMPSAAPPVLGIDGRLFSTTNLGGNTETNGCGAGCGTLFAITPTGAFTTVHTFCETVACDDGAEPNGVVMVPDGNFLGATKWADGYFLGGSVYEIAPTGNLSALHMFDGETGAGFSQPTQPIQGSDGNLYGTMAAGGIAGMFYKLTPEGKITVLYGFCSMPGCADGAGPNQVIQGTDGNFYGTTASGGTSTDPRCSTAPCGTLFQITPAGKLTTLHSFCSETNCADGAVPVGALIQATNGNFYGSVELGGISSNCGAGGCGTIFSLSMGLSPFVEANPNFGSAGQSIVILGNNLTGTTGVSFNGKVAAFKVESDSYLKAEVPAGATTGMIEVTTATGVLSSNVAFQVQP